MSRLEVDVLQSPSNPHINIPLSYIYNLIGFPKWMLVNVPYRLGQVVFDDGALWQSLANGNEIRPKTDDGQYWRMVLIDELSQLNDVANINNSIGELNVTVNALQSTIGALDTNVDAMIIALDGEDNVGGVLYNLDQLTTTVQNLVYRIEQLEDRSQQVVE